MTRQLYYEVSVESYPVLALLDPGASHSFISHTWAELHRLQYSPLEPPRRVGVFNGQIEYIRWVVHVKRFAIGQHSRS